MPFGIIPESRSPSPGFPNLPNYMLIRPDEVRNFMEQALQSRRVLFEVSAIGYNKDHTRVLVYVGHHCGSLCGGGAYHLLVKKGGKWQVDLEFRGGPSCLWKS